MLFGLVPVFPNSFSLLISLLLEIVQEMFLWAEKENQEKNRDSLQTGGSLPQFNGVDVIAEFTIPFAEHLHFKCDAHEEIMV